MSAGAINLAETAICTLTCQHRRLEIYPALGCAELSVEPHFDRQNVTGELLCLSQIYTIYGLCDDSMILCADGKAVFYGDVYRLRHGVIEKCEHA